MKNTREDEELLIEAVISAHRHRDPHGEAVVFHPAWYDLDESARERAFEGTRQARAMEAALDPQGLSTTAQRVLRRIRGA